MVIRRPFAVLLPSVALGSLVLGGACSSGHEGGAQDAGADTYGVHVGDGTGGNGDGTSDAPAVTTSLRLAHAAETVGAVDYCWRVAGAASYQGPVLNGGVAPVIDASTPEAGATADASGDGAPATDAEGADAAGDDASSEASADASDESEVDASPGVPEASLPGDGSAQSSLSFGAMTPALTVTSSGTFDLAVVHAGQTSCAAPLLTGKVTLDAGKSATVVLMGAASPATGAQSLSLVAFTDEARDPQSAKVRIVHAAVGSATSPATAALIVRAGSTLLTDDVEPGDTSPEESTPSVDAQGYTSLTPIGVPVALSLSTTGDAAPATWTTPSTDLGIGTGTIHTGIVVTLDQGALGVVWCAAAVESDAAPTCALLPASL